MLKATITRYINALFDTLEEPFDEFEVKSFDEALEKCKLAGSAGGFIDSAVVEIYDINKENMTAEFIIKNRMRYQGDTFTLIVKEQKPIR